MVEDAPAAMIDERVGLASFRALAGRLGGLPFVKVVVERTRGRTHFIDEARYRFHSDYIGEQILGVPGAEIDRDIDRFNASIYHEPDRRFCVGSVALHEGEKPYFTLETVEIDTMGEAMILELYAAVRSWLDPAHPLLFKPSSHDQEAVVARIPTERLPRILSSELFAETRYLPLNPGRARGRLRCFRDVERYRAQRESIAWYDILVMPRLPDDVPRVSGMIHAERTTPLSHTNVLASGWGIPNAVEVGVIERVEAHALDGHWVELVVETEARSIGLELVEAPSELGRAPWAKHVVVLEPPELHDETIVRLDELRAADRDRFGTKAANLGELSHVYAHGSARLTGFYSIARPPRANLRAQLAERLGVSASADLEREALEFLRRETTTPRGVALPFALGRKFLEASPAIQQHIGRLKMALELGAPQLDAVAVELVRAIRTARFPVALHDAIDAAVATELGGVGSFVVRSSSNAEDLVGFSAAGVYESVTHVTDEAGLFDGIRRVWASLYSPRSVRLRADAGIPIDDAWMGVIVQEEVPVEGAMGGVLVTSHPTAPADFRSAYLNVSLGSVVEVVAGTSDPIQVYCNTVDGGSRAVSVDARGERLDPRAYEALERLALAGRLLQGHFSSDYTYSTALDIEWIWRAGRSFLLQVRPYGR
jgi:phosphoenolpyruvate synthase/pyruvate phosphate dikinase